MSFVAKTKPGQPTDCNGCGHLFKQDPIYFVDCPVCHAKAGTYCKRPSGHAGPLINFHAERDIKALVEGYYDHSGQNEKCGPHSTSKRTQELLEKYPLLLKQMKEEEKLKRK